MMKSETQKDYKALLIGVGKFGDKHAENLLSLSDQPHVDFAAIADHSMDKAIAAAEKYADQDVFFINDAPSEDEINACSKAGVEILSSVKDVVEQSGVNTISNVTNNFSHAQVLRDALSANVNIHTIFQEKPFGLEGEDLSDIEAAIGARGITFDMNSILLGSPIWDHVRDVAEEIGSEPVFIASSYGKPRQSDTRPAPGGWAGMDSIHALDIISGMFLQDIEIDPDHLEGRFGYLSENAAQGLDDVEPGHAMFSLNANMVGVTSEGVEIPVLMEGSFAWDEQVRRVQFFFDDGEDLKVVQLDFDVLEDDARNDIMRVNTINFDHGVGIATEIQKIVAEKPNKLGGFYKRIFDGHPPLCGLEKTASLKNAVHALQNPVHVERIDANAAPTSPALSDAPDLAPRVIDILNALEESAPVKSSELNHD